MFVSVCRRDEVLVQRDFTYMCPTTCLNPRQHDGVVLLPVLFNGRRRGWLCGPTIASSCLFEPRAIFTELTSVAHLVAYEICVRMQVGM